MTRNLLVFLAIFALTPAARAEGAKQGRGYVSVFPLSPSGPVNANQLALFDEQLVAKTTQWLTPLGYSVLPAADTIRLMVDNGIPLEQIAAACEASCVLETAKTLNVKVFVAGVIRILADEGTVSAFVRMYDGTTGALIRSTPELSGENVKDVRLAFDAQSEAFFRDAVEALDPAIKEERLRREAAAKAAEEEAAQLERDRRAAEKWRLPETNPIYDGGGRLAVRGGFGTLIGVLGGGVEFFPWSKLGFALGFGVYRTVGVSFRPFGYEDGGGPYLDASFGSVGGDRPEKGVGGTIGWDVRPLKWVSVKAGVGAAWTSLSQYNPHPRPLLFDLSGGLVF